jgi:putative transposase
LKELAGSRTRYGYRRLTVMLRREGWKVNTKRVYRIYREEQLQVRTTKQAKRPAHLRVALPQPAWPNQRWSMDFVSDRLVDGRWFRILTVVDQYTRECLCAHADRPQTGNKVVEQMERLVAQHGAPESITTDNGGEFAGKAMETWAYQNDVKLDLIRPGKPVEKAYASYCTSCEPQATFSGKRRRLASLAPCAFRGGLGPGSSYSQSSRSFSG